MSRAAPNKSQLLLSSPIPHLSIPIQSFTESQMAQILDQADPIITQWDVDTAAGFAKVTSLFHENHRGEANNFINYVNQLHETMRSLLAENSSSKMLVPAQVLIQNAIKRLRKEFCQLLSTNRAYLDPESVSIRSSAFSTRSSHSSKTSTNSDSSSTDHDDSGDEIRVADKAITEGKNASVVAMADLKLIAECMISTGYGKECVEIYKNMRRSILDEGLYKLGIEKVSSSKIHKLDWEVLDLKIKNWLKAVNTAVDTLFKGEKVLCDQVFAASGTVRELCFNEVTKEGATILFSFPELVVKSNKRSPVKIFRLLDMYNAIASNWPEIESIFSSDFLSESSSTIIDLALNSTIKLRNSVLSALTEFESSIQKQSTSKTPAAADAGVHRFTTEVMNYLSLLADYSVLEDMLLDCQLPVKSTSLPESYFDASNNEEAPATSRRIAWLIFVLLCKLDAIARHYKDISHSYLFLANNLRYIIFQVRTSNLRYFLGDDWIIKHEAKVDRFAASYERLGWSHVIDSIPAVNLSSPEDVEESFRRFNAAFVEAHGKQSVCVVQDSKLRDEIKLSIAKKLLPLYREFYNAHLMRMRRERKFAYVVRFTPEDLSHALSDLFFGSGESRSTSFSSSRS